MGLGMFQANMTKRKIGAALYFAISFLMGLIGAVAQADSSNQLDFYFQDRKGVVSSELLGTNLFYPTEHDAIWENGRVAGLLKKINTGHLRYPGGEVTSSFHWKNPTGIPFIDSWEFPNTAISPSSQWMSVDEYLVTLKKTGGRALLGINIQSGYNFPNRKAESLKEAIDLVSYIKNRHIENPTYFIDNEEYASNAHMSAETYAHLINEYADKMRAVDPTLNIVANWQNKTDGLATILNIAARNIDYIDFHFYWNRGAADFANWTGPQPMRHENGKGKPELTYIEKIYEFSNLVKGYTNAKGKHIGGYLNSRGVYPKLAAFEWNIGPTQSNIKPSRFQAALMNSEMMMQFIMGNLDAAALFPMHYDLQMYPGETYHSELAPHSSQTPDELLSTPMYKMLGLYSSIMGAQRIGVDSGVPGVYLTAAYRPENDTATIFLLEKEGKSRDLKIDMHGFIGKENYYSVERKMMRGAGGSVTSEGAEFVDSIPYQIDKTNGSISVKIEPYTLTRLIIHRLPGASAQVMQVYIVAGQSNAVGPFATEGYSAQANADSRVLFSYPQIAYEFHPLELQYTPSLLNTPNFLNNPDLQKRPDFKQHPEKYAYRGGVEIALARNAIDLIDSIRHDKIGEEKGKVALIKFAQGNTSLAGDWLAGSNPLKNRFIHALRAKLDYLHEYANNNHLKVKIVGLYWAQGENDAKVRAFAEGYKANLEKFMKDVRGVIGEQPKVIIAQLNSKHRGEYKNLIRSAQEHFVDEAKNNAVLINGDDLELLPDGTHYQFKSLQELGNRAYRTIAKFAESVLKN